MPTPVTTIYTNPWERVVFWPERDANPFFHLYEALWMLAGRSDVLPLARYSKNILNYSDDGKVLHGAYGKRWRDWFSMEPGDTEVGGMDQLRIIADTLIYNKDDRRCVLQMWDPEFDLAVPMKDVPCNTTATFGICRDGGLELTVFCRSNDIVWGAYGANAVHFSMLQEYMARWIGVPIGNYYQISVNWHGYRDTFDPLAKALEIEPFPFSVPLTIKDPYADKTVVALPMLIKDIGEFDSELKFVLHALDNDSELAINPKSEFLQMAFRVLKTHEYFRKFSAPEKYEHALACLKAYKDQQVDWIVAAREWIERRQAKWQEKMDGGKEQARVLPNVGARTTGE
jgi:thymidylate synthase